MTTSIRASGYAEIVGERKILYMPSCLVVEMMTKLYSQVSMINLCGSVHNVVPDLFILLRRLTHNLRATADAYKSERIRFFLGDWKDDKLRARRLFFNLMSRLGYVCELLAPMERNLLYKALEEVAAEWNALDAIMEEKCRSGRCAGTCVHCGSFRATDEDWEDAMAKTLIALDAEADYPDSETYLILLCYERVKKTLVDAIERRQRRTTIVRRFVPGRILSLSNEDFPINCRSCAQAADAPRRGSTEILRRDYAAAGRRTAQSRRVTELMPRGRYPMPPSLAGMESASTFA